MRDCDGGFNDGYLLKGNAEEVDESEVEGE